MKNPKMRTAALVIVLMLAAGLAVWFLMSPTMRRNEAQKQQDALLESIEQGDGVIVVDGVAAEDVAPVDYYDAPDSGEDVIRLFWTPPEGTVAAPASQPADTGEITGIGVLTIDAIDLVMPVAGGVSEAQLKIAAGWVPQTAPIGETGNAVIAGHRNYTHGSHFNRLGELAVGDVIRYTPKGGEEMTFTVHEILEVLPGDQSAFEQPDDEQVLTLYTCTPIRTATHRLLVRATRTA